MISFITKTAALWKRALPLAIAVPGLPLAVFVLSCGDTGTKGDLNHTHSVYAILIQDAATSHVTAYLELNMDNKPLSRATVKVLAPDTTVVPPNNLVPAGDGKYYGLFPKANFGVPNTIRVTSDSVPFQFNYLISIPDTFTSEITGLANNQVFASTQSVTLQWTPSQRASGYLVVAEPTNPTNPAVGFAATFNGQIGSVPREAFRNSQGAFQTGTYNIWVVSYVGSPIDYLGLPFAIPGGLFAANVNLVGVSGKIGAVYLPEPLVVTAVSK